MDDFNYEDLELYAFDEEMNSDPVTPTEDQINAADRHGCLFGALFMAIAVVGAILAIG